MIENRVIPIRSTDAEIDVAISEPSALNLVSGIRLLTDKKVNAYIASFSQVDQFLTSLDDLSIDQVEAKKINITEQEVDKSKARSLWSNAYKIGAALVIKWENKLISRTECLDSFICFL